VARPQERGALEELRLWVRWQVRAYQPGGSVYAEAGRVDAADAVIDPGLTLIPFRPAQEIQEDGPHHRGRGGSAVAAVPKLR